MSPLAGFLDNQEPTSHPSPDDWHPPPHFPQKQRRRHVPPAICHTRWYTNHSRILLHTRCKNPHPLNHWRLCCWLRIFFFSLETGLAGLQGLLPNCQQKIKMVEKEKKMKKESVPQTHFYHETSLLANFTKHLSLFITFSSLFSSIQILAVLSRALLISISPPPRSLCPCGFLWTPFDSIN